MFVRSLSRVEATDKFVDWGNGIIHRLLTAQDKLGHTILGSETNSELQYRNYFEACYRIDGEGDIEDLESNVFPIRKGDIYILDVHDRHFLCGGEADDLLLVSVFNLPLKGTDAHNFNDPDGYAY